MPRPEPSFNNYSREPGTLTRNIAYRPLPSQCLFHASRSRYRLYSGAVGSGKSLALVHEALRLAFVNHGLLGLIGAPTYRVLHDTTERAFFEVLDANKIPYRYNKSDKECLLTDLDSRIIFRTLDDPTRLVGTNLSWFAIDEAAYIDEASFLRLQARLREPQATQLCGIGATTPAGLNWVYDRFLGDKKTEHFEMIRAVPGENHYLPDDFYASLAKSYDPRFYQQEVLGHYLSLTSGTAYSAFDRTLNVDPGILYNPSAKLIVTADYNIDPMSWLIGQLIDFAPTVYTSTQNTRRLEILQESIIRDSTINAACSALIDRIKAYRRPSQHLTIHFYGDASGHNRTRAGDTDYSLIKQFFARQDDYELVWHVPTGNPTVRDRVNTVNAVLQNAVGATRLTIHPSCLALIKDLERMTWAQDTHGNSLDGLSKKDKLLGHASDALGYCVYREFPLTGGSYGYQSTRII
jgi:hypothetical protein